MKRRKIIFAMEIMILIFGVNYVMRLAPKSLVFAAIKTKLVDQTKELDIKEGDFIFQHLSVKLTEVIASITASPYSHCGIVIREEGQWLVLEAIGPVIKTPLNQWIHRGVGSKITIVRLKGVFQQSIPAIIKEAQAYLDCPYDILYEWDDAKIYCSELIYKAVLKGAGLRLAEFKKLGDLNWRPHEDFIRAIAGGDLPLEREMITPQDLVTSEKVEIIYSTF